MWIFLRLVFAMLESEGWPMRGAMMAEKMETVVLAKTGAGYEMSDGSGETIAWFQSWEPVADMFRRADYSEEYIASRKVKADTGDQAVVDEKNE
jgi:hypothetical protein